MIFYIVSVDSHSFIKNFNDDLFQNYGIDKSSSLIEVNENLVSEINLKNKKEQRADIEDDELNFLSKRGSKMLLISAVSTCMESLLGKKILDSWRLVFKDNKNFDKLVEEWKAILDVLMPWHSTLEPAIVSGLKSKEATQNAAKQLRATLTSFSSMYAQQLKTSLDKGTQRKTTENELPSLTQCTA